MARWESTAGPSRKGRAFNNSGPGKLRRLRGVDSSASSIGDIEGASVVCLESVRGDGTAVDCLESVRGDGTAVDCLESVRGDGAAVDCLESVRGDIDEAAVDCFVSVSGETASLQLWRSVLQASWRAVLQVRLESNFGGERASLQEVKIDLHCSASRKISRDELSECPGAWSKLSEWDRRGAGMRSRRPPSSA